MAGNSAESKKFHPPKWCCAPRDPAQTKQAVRFLPEDGSSGYATPQPAGVTVSSKAVYTIGRSERGVDIRLKGELASRMHAAILQDVDGRKFVVDLRSTHGTFLDGKKLTPHEPCRWPDGARVSFGSGSMAEVIDLAPATNGVTGARSIGDHNSTDNRHPLDIDGDAEEIVLVAPKRRRTHAQADAAGDDPLAALYKDLPEAQVTECRPMVEASKRLEPLPPPAVIPTKCIFLDIDGVLRTVHGRTDFAKDVRTMTINGQKVAMLGDSSNGNLAGIDFWPSALRALRYTVQKTSASIVLSSDWRKDEGLVEGVNNQLVEYGMAKLLGVTPDLGATNMPGVAKALHSNVREKRCKEIRKWLRQHPNIERWVAIDDMDLTASRKDEILHIQSGGTEPMAFLDGTMEFVRCNPAVGYTMELAKLAVSFLNGVGVTDEDLATAYGQGPHVQDVHMPPPDFQGLGPGLFG